MSSVEQENTVPMSSAKKVLVCEDCGQTVQLNTLYLHLGHKIKTSIVTSREDVISNEVELVDFISEVFGHPKEDLITLNPRFKHPIQ